MFQTKKYTSSTLEIDALADPKQGFIRTEQGCYSK